MQPFQKNNVEKLRAATRPQLDHLTIYINYRRKPKAAPDMNAMQRNELSNVIRDENNIIRVKTTSWGMLYYTTTRENILRAASGVNSFEHCNRVAHEYEIIILNCPFKNFPFPSLKF